MIDVPYIPQTQQNSCGAAALGMLINYHGIAVSQPELIGMLRINEVGYTSKTAIGHALTTFGLTFKEFSMGGPDGGLLPGNLERMLEQVKMGDPVMVNYISDTEGHYGVVVGYDGDHLLIHDPETGPNKRMKIPD